MNIVLIGMPGCGKSTLGVLLAKSLLMDFVDCDLIIQGKYGNSLCDIIQKEGLDGFKEIEDSVLAEIKCENSVIATGGSAVYGKRAMANLKENSRTIYLKLSPKNIEKRIKNITTRGIAMKEGTTIKDLYNERAPLYEKYADITVDCNNGTVEDTVKAVIDSLIK